MNTSMNVEYDVRVIDLAKHMHEVSKVEDISYEHPTHGKKLKGLHSAMTAVSKLHNKTFEQVHEDISTYAGWMAIQDCIYEVENMVGEPVALVA